MARKRVITLKGEKVLYVLIGLLVIFNVLGQSFSMALLSKTNIEVESMRTKIETQQNLNASLEMKINELASLDNIQSVAYSYGLKYNNDNIRVIEEWGAIKWTKQEPLD